MKTEFGDYHMINYGDRCLGEICPLAKILEKQRGLTRLLIAENMAERNLVKLEPDTYNGDPKMEQITVNCIKAGVLNNQPCGRVKLLIPKICD